MPEPIFYMRGLPAIGFEANPDMLADLGLIAELSSGDVDRVSVALRQERGFLHTSALRKRVSATISDEETAKAVARALQYLEPDDIEGVIKQVERAREAEATDLSDEQVENLRRNLSELIQVYPALARFEKAQRLAVLTGQRLDSADLICDLRPIFDKTGEHVEGIFPYTRLRLVATGVDGLPRDFEVELTVEQVYKLSENADRAKTKLAALRESIQEWVPDGVPALPQIRVPKKERR
ncbi:MAG TPA: hypothetical protein VFE47_08685 [Tepidisphaeraceae bacterium]|jgi:hypothetical protein|nr:hypothetical protein [Tepidisphaeraceae bacterium]